MAKYLPHGTKLTFNGQLVGGLVSVSIPGRTRGAAEITDSNSAYTRDFIPGLRDPGTMQLTFRHDPADAGQIALVTNFNQDYSNNVVTCILELPQLMGNRFYTFDGFVISAPAGDLGLADDTVAELTCTIQVASAIVIS